MRSMTGYGKAQYQTEDWNIIIEMRTVNHRFLDISSQIPNFLLPIENKIKQMIKKHLHRGRVELSIQIQGEQLQQQRMRTNWNLVRQYVEQLKEVQKELNLAGEITIDLVARLPQVMEIEEEDSKMSSHLDSIILEKIAEALKQVEEMRKKEGQNLCIDILNYIRNIENKLKWLGERRNIVIIEYQERIKARMDEYLQDAPIIDQTKLNQDIAVLAEKGDISEELARLHSHINQFASLVHEVGAVGRRLDFIVQEMHRECNTIGSKSNDAGISEQIIHMKSDLEKIKEQIQNIE
ncbi:YicC/YloC family endoribonuclease [Gracilibacillus dipsosauri]|uniref:YicC family protein n=1 Tax=Gracilibacillus dipsosauri TaxID=178340 RepID=A0A317KZE3_9BACI|nr:YicC/YloC family endoribonuclease [Gracilibacillus dipsosauri]PWU68922.1 YicC family protein [Gracilibacillus dipsosauri]